MAASSKDSDAKAIDVAKPGKTAPDTTARPVIITHRPMVQDPMVKSEEKADEPTDTKADSSKTKVATGSHGDKVIQPVSMSPDAETAEPEDKADEETPSPDAEASSEAAVVDAVVQQTEATGKKNGELTEEDKAKEEHLQKLIADKTYFVSVGQVARRRNRRASVVVILLIVVLAAGGYLALDAGVIHSTIKLPVDLIHN